MLQLSLTDPQTLAYIKTIGYPTMFLVMIAEGPIITIIAAFLASLNYFNVFLVFLLSLLGDIVGDIIFYLIGYHGGSRVLEKAEKILKIKSTTVEKLKNLFTNHGQKTIFAVKSTTGLCWITFIAAGSVKMDLKKFLGASFLGGIVWSSFLVISGFFFGYAFEKINDYIRSAGLLIAASAIGFFTLITLYKKYRARKMFGNGSL